MTYILNCVSDLPTNFELIFFTIIINLVQKIYQFNQNCQIKFKNRSTSLQLLKYESNF